MINYHEYIKLQILSGQNTDSVAIEYLANVRIFPSISTIQDFSFFFKSSIHENCSLEL